MKPNHIVWLAAIFAVLLLGRCNPHHGQTTTPDLTGKWKGNLTTSHMSGSMELVLARSGEEWTGQVMTPSEDGPRTQAVRGLEVKDRQLSFSCDIHDIRVMFMGKLIGENLVGTFDGAGGGFELSGEWKLSR
ncbi:MAG: hypothetical protein HY646_09930 [Acidobacteria bacterium]|nr:hypothetical protein [Acidobacteriota bacterium]